jgi:hypothetical protein
MADEIGEMCRRMHLSDRERQHTRLRSAPVARSHQVAQFSILFKLLSNRQFNGDALKSTV